MTIINRDTFTQTGEVHRETVKSRHIGDWVYSYTPGTVEVTLHGKVRRVDAQMFDDGKIIVSGLVGRYQSASKLWPAIVTSQLRDGTVIEIADFGRDDRDPKFRKESAIWFKD